MTKNEFMQLLQQRNYLISTIQADKTSIETTEDSIDKMELNIMKLQHDMKSTKMQQVIDEINAKVKNLQKGIANAKDELEKKGGRRDTLRQRQDELARVVSEIEKEKKIMAGDFSDAQVEQEQPRLDKRFKRP